MQSRKEPIWKICILQIEMHLSAVVTLHSLKESVLIYSSGWIHRVYNFLFGALTVLN